MSVVVEGLVVRHGNLLAVDGASFEASAGSVTVVLGPNGAGKTSTIETCEGFRRPDAGTVRVLGLDPVADHARLVGRMGVMLQDGGIYPSARVTDTVRHFCALNDDRVDADGLVERLGLASRARAAWRTLSGGERQRLSLALALSCSPRVAFLDEPTAGVDVEGRDVIRSIVADLAADGCTVVVASHEMAEAEKIADKVVMMRSGRVVADGTVESLVRQRNRLTFQSDPGLDVAVLGAALGAVVADYGSGTYEVAHAPTAELVARVTSWLASAGKPLRGVDLGQESLEDAYRRLVGDES